MLLEKSLSKDIIIKNINKQLEDLIFYYEEQLQLIETENSKLKQELLSYKNQLAEKEKQFQDLTEKKEQLNTPEKVAPRNFSTLQLLQMFPHYIGQTEKFLKQQKYQECLKIVNKLIEVMNPNAYSSNGGKSLVSLFKEIMKSDLQKGSGNEELFIKLFFFIQMFHQKHEIRSFLSNHLKQFTILLKGTQNDLLVADLGKIVFLKEEYNKQLGDYLEVVSQDWDNFTNKIDQNTLIKLLWLDLIKNKINPILHKNDSNIQKLNQNLPEVQLYDLFRNLVFGKIDTSEVGTQFKELKEKVTIFSSEEQKRLINTLNSVWGEKPKKKKLKEKSKEISNTSKQLRKMSFVTKLPSEKQILPGTGISLKEEWIALAVYKDIYLKEPIKYIRAKVLTYHETSKAFVTEKLIHDIKKEVGKNRIDIRDHRNTNQVVASEYMTVTTKTNQPFAWPSTELKGQTIEEKGLFNDESELKKLGYQITGTTREKRWSILTTAVKTLGLRKVAYQIAHHVKLRKGQKGGGKKFVYAITEWEYDLAKLKQHYYKNDFVWPNTK